MNPQQNDPFAPKYGVGPQTPPPPQQYGGVPVGQPKKGMNILLIPFILAVFLLFGALGFGFWAYDGMQDYKNNVQPKIDKAVAIAEERVSSEKDKEFVEREKKPVKSYKAPQNAGSLSIEYPKTWSAYVEEPQSGSEIVNGYFHPNYVPSEASGTDFALRIEVINRNYDQELRSYESKTKNGKVTVSAYEAPKMKGKKIIGVRINGELNTGQQGSMAMFQLRDKTIKVSTQSPQFVGDFENIILNSLVFEP